MRNLILAVVAVAGFVGVAVADDGHKYPLLHSFRNAGKMAGRANLAISATTDGRGAKSFSLVRSPQQQGGGHDRGYSHHSHSYYRPSYCGPRYYPRPYYYAPAPVFCAPPPVVVAAPQPTIVVPPPPIVVTPQAMALGGGLAPAGQPQPQMAPPSPAPAGSQPAAGMPVDQYTLIRAQLPSDLQAMKIVEVKRHSDGSLKEIEGIVEGKGKVEVKFDHGNFRKVEWD